MQILIRQANLEDVSILREFEQGVVEAERPFAANLKSGPVEYYDLPQLIESEQACLLVAEFAGKIVACGYARIEQDKPYFTPQQFAYLGFMYVAPEMRGMGVNQRILAALESWTLDQGVKMLKLDVYANNAAALRAYQKYGFEAQLLQMIKPLG